MNHCSDNKTLASTVQFQDKNKKNTKNTSTSNIHFLTAYSDQLEPNHSWTFIPQSHTSYTTEQIWTKRNVTIKTKTPELAEFYHENNHRKSKLAMKSGQRAWGAPSHQLYDKASTETNSFPIPSNRPQIFDRLRNARESPSHVHFGHSTAWREEIRTATPIWEEWRNNVGSE